LTVVPVQESLPRDRKAAPVVIKWGGGHGARKKEQGKKKVPCRFGAACHRWDCWFNHPPERQAPPRPEGGTEA
jgi:hypothetical protein